MSEGRRGAGGLLGFRDVGAPVSECSRSPSCRSRYAVPLGLSGSVSDNGLQRAPKKLEMLLMLLMRSMLGFRWSCLRKLLMVP